LLVAVTVTPGSTLLLGSVTRPLRAPVCAVCAHIHALLKTNAVNGTSVRIRKESGLRMVLLLSGCFDVLRLRPDDSNRDRHGATALGLECHLRRV
jgi:hypothetical protein